MSSILPGSTKKAQQNRHFLDRALPFPPAFECEFPPKSGGEIRGKAFAWCSRLATALAFAAIVFLTAWHGPDCRLPKRSISIGGAVLVAACGRAP
jgi:hypothetical protein